MLTEEGQIVAAKWGNLSLLWGGSRLAYGAINIGNKPKGRPL